MNSLILFAGLAVIASKGIPGLLYILAAVLLSYGAGLLIPKRRWVFWVSAAVNTAMLVIQKFQGIWGVDLLAVMGLSYFTLQIIAYNADVYKGKYEPEKNLLLYALHITYIPHMFIGPIEGYPKMKQNLLSRRFSWDGISEGAIRAIWGLFKKYVIAARAGVIIGAISAKPDTYSGAFAFAAMLLYSLQLYADFSGGIDMVLGASRMLGITMSENFDAPYFSQSFQEFWRRWHMTLGGWLREYVYIPLGGNRKGKTRKLINSIVTFLVSGLWHGAEYILWGLFNGIFVAFGESCKTRWKLLNRLGTFLMVSLLWSFFVWPDMVTASQMVLSVFTTFNYGAFFGEVASLGLTVTDWIVMAAATLLLWGYDWKRTAIGEKIHGMSPAARTAVACALGLAVLVFGMYGIGFNASAFIYSQF